jgi:MFS-type transporter involved in bile tolerance (Atg22 family)
MLRLSPPDKIGEFFGLYGLAGKFSAVTGPVLYGVIVSSLLDAGWGKSAYQVGILSFLILMVVGLLLLRGVPDPGTEPGDAEAGGAPGSTPPPEHLVPAHDMPSEARS